jgi:hypothetical protein
MGVGALAIAAVMAGCGGGTGTENGANNINTGSPRILTINGTAATGRAIAAASVMAKCQTGTGSTTTAADGTFTLRLTGGSLPCMLQTTDPSDKATLHTVAPADGANAGVTVTANITPLTEMLSARALSAEPAAFFAAFDAKAAELKLSDRSVALAQADVKVAINEAINTSSLADWIATPLRAATASNPAGGDAQDLLLDTLRTQLDGKQLPHVVTALATSSPPAQVKQVVADRVAASAAKLTSVVNLDSNTVVLAWTDAYPAGTTYRVEAQNQDGSFSALETLSGTSGTGGAMQWQRAVTVKTVYRVVAVLPDRVLVISTPQGQDAVTVPGPGAAPAIVVSQAEPLAGTVQLSVSGTSAYTSVAWYADLKLIDKSSVMTNGAANAVNWNTSVLANGTHLLLARVQVGTDSYLDIRRNVTVSNSNLAVSASVSGTTGSITIDARASSQYGVTSVEATFDGAPLAVLSSPNACSRYCSAGNDVYRFTINAALAGSGNHSVVITAKDAASGIKSITLAVPVANLPVLTVSSPVDGAFVFGNLQLNGSSSSDKTGAVRVTASLGDVEFINTTSPSFSGSFNLSGLTPGTYTLTVRATDSANLSSVVQRTVTVTSGNALAYPALFSLGATGQMLAVEGDWVLYRGADGTLRLRHVINQTEVMLADAHTISYANDWQLSGGRVVAYGKGADCVLYCVYLWDSSGAIKNLSNPNHYSAAANIGGGRAYDLHPVAKNGYVAWVNDKANTSGGANPTGWYTLYNIAQNTYTKIDSPVGAAYVGNWNYQLNVSAGTVTFDYWAQTGGTGTSSSFDVFRWTSASQTSTRITSGGSRNIYPKSDEYTLTWLQSSATSTSGLSSLLSVANSNVTATPTLLSSQASENFVLRDGVLAWLDTANANRALKVAVSGSVSTLSNLDTAVLYGAGGGHLVFGEAGKTYSWDSTTKTTTRRIDSAPNQVLMSANSMYFVMGSGQAVYRVALN